MSSKEREGGCSFGIQRDAFSWLVEFRHGIPKRATCVTNNTKCGLHFSLAHSILFYLLLDLKVNLNIYVQPKKNIGANFM